ncbi:MAG: hypothetical protein RW306_16205 [Geobacteraceae bacterium]|nr:hypothetical protein [Geobacteraceae bacterium]
MRNQTRINEILTGAELLRIESLHRQIPSSDIKRKITSLTIIFILGSIFSIWKYREDIIPLLFFLGFVSMIYALMVAFIKIYLQNKGNPLIFTDKGIVLPNIAANFWNEIESYGWEEYKGWNKVPGPTVFSASEGSCLNLTLKGGLSIFLPRWCDSKGGNIFATALIFFSKEQIAKAEEIFSNHSISKR